MIDFIWFILMKCLISSKIDKTLKVLRNWKMNQRWAKIFCVIAIFLGRFEALSESSICRFPWYNNFYLFGNNIKSVEFKIKTFFLSNFFHIEICFEKCCSYQYVKIFHRKYNIISKIWEKTIIFVTVIFPTEI